MRGHFNSSYIRNICAHHGRLLNRQTVKCLPNIKRSRQDLVIIETATDKEIQAQPANFIYAALVALANMLFRQSADTIFAERFATLVKTRSADQLRRWTSRLTGKSALAGQLEINVATLWSLKAHVPEPRSHKRRCMFLSGRRADGSDFHVPDMRVLKTSVFHFGQI